jgi:hypothetical protein
MQVFSKAFSMQKYFLTKLWAKNFLRFSRAAQKQKISPISKQQKHKQICNY